MAIFECVPNFSEGRDASFLDDASTAVEACGAKVLHRTGDPVHHRSVLTFAGERDALLGAAVALARLACERIDLRSHRGVHPRMGALDVLPFIPLGNATMHEAVALAEHAGARIWEQLRIPSYLYGEAARIPQRRLLSDVRRGEFEGLIARPPDSGHGPDIGDLAAHPTAGAIAIGARRLLVAFNIELATGDIGVARRIARTLRERNRGLQTLRALGFAIDERRVQVSFNVTDVHATPLSRILELVRILAAREGVAVIRSEFIGLLPRAALEAAALDALGIASPLPSPERSSPT